MNITPSIYKRNNSAIDFVFSLSPDQILEILSRDYSRPKRGRPMTLNEEMMEKLYQEIDAGEASAVLAEKYGLSVSTINRFRRHRVKESQEASNATSKKAT